MSVQDVRTPARSRRSPRSGRAQVRHRALLEAALDVIGREGIDALSHRRVAEVAGVPLGSTTYDFTSREDMLAGPRALRARRARRAAPRVRRLERRLGA